MSDLNKIVSAFEIEGEVAEIKPLGNGLINKTYKVITKGDTPDYVLQWINNSIFTDVDLLQHNIDVVTSHIREKLLAAGETDIDRKVLRFIKVRETGKSYLEDGGAFWRISVFIPDSYTYETVTEEYSYNAGLAFGQFEAMLSDIDEELGETIPDFHNIELRVAQLAVASDHDRCCRIDEPEEGDDRHPIEGDIDHRDEVCDLLEDIDRYVEEMCKSEDLYRDGVLPKRICHCDTKVNNMLYDKDGNILCVIDLDTVMPSFVFSDYGDFLRSAANTAAEDEPDTSKIQFNMDIFRAFTKGYIGSAKSFLTKCEIDNLPYAACMFPYMQAVRFLTDYLDGDKYYQTKYIDHNFVRARAQMALFHRALEHRDEMADYIASLLKG